MNNHSTRSRRKNQRGSEALEFTFVMVPLLFMLFVLLNIAWAIFVKTTLQRAVRIGVRTGITLQTVAAGSNLTDTVKGVVQSSALGLLNGTTGYGYIKVHYFLPPASSSTNPPTDVSSALNADAGGNIMQVSVEGYSLAPFVPRIYSWTQAPDNNPLLVSVYAADLIEPNRTPPPVGTAP